MFRMVSPKTDDATMTSAAMFCSAVNTCFDEVDNNHFYYDNRSEFWSPMCQSEFFIVDETLITSISSCLNFISCKRDLFSDLIICMYFSLLFLEKPKLEKRAQRKIPRQQQQSMTSDIYLHSMAWSKQRMAEF